jgi:hypothetical protein
VFITQHEPEGNRISCLLNISIENTEKLSLEQIRAFLQVSQEVRFEAMFRKRDCSPETIRCTSLDLQSLFNTGWPFSFGPPDESTRPAGQLTSGQTGLNRVRAIAFVSQRLPMH